CGVGECCQVGELVSLLAVLGQAQAERGGAIVGVDRVILHAYPLISQQSVQDEFSRVDVALEVLVLRVRLKRDAAPNVAGHCLNNSVPYGLSLNLKMVGYRLPLNALSSRRTFIGLNGLAARIPGG